MDEFKTIKSDYDIIIQDNDEELTNKNKKIEALEKESMNMQKNFMLTTRKFGEKIEMLE
jgi:hypothetical protein